MPSRRYTISIADCGSGAARSATVSVRIAAAVIGVVIAAPVLIGIGAVWKGWSDVEALRVSHDSLELENANYRQATQALAGQIESLQAAISDLGARSALDPNLARAMNRLPAIVKSRAMGGGGGRRPRARRKRSFRIPERCRRWPRLKTRSACSGRCWRASGSSELVQRNVEKRNALAAATPSMWPASRMAVVRDGSASRPGNGRL